MTTSKEKPSFTLCSLCFETTQDYEQNLHTLISLIQKSPENAFIVAPEVSLTGFDYENIKPSCDFSAHAKAQLFKVLGSRVLIITMMELHQEKLYNVASVLHQGKVIHTQAKHQLFKLGDEHKYFSPGALEDIVLFEINGLKIGLLICFELRFKILHQRLEGADIIAVPSMWGKPRSAHFKTLTSALALINQCYVVAADSANEDMTALSGIINPSGEEIRNNGAQLLTQDFKEKEIKLARRYLDIGINHR